MVDLKFGLTAGMSSPMPKTKVEMLGSAVASQGTGSLQLSFGGFNSSEFSKIELKCWMMCNDGSSGTDRRLVLTLGGISSGGASQFEFIGWQDGGYNYTSGNGSTTGAIYGASMTGYASQEKVGRMFNLNIWDPGKNNTSLGSLGITFMSFGPNAAKFNTNNRSKFSVAGAYRPAKDPISTGGLTSLTLSVDGSTFGAGSRIDAYGWPNGA